MFGEPVDDLREYTDKETGKKFREFVQVSPWNSGPMIFTALEKVLPTGKTEPIQKTLWIEDSSIGDCEYDPLSGKYYV